MLFPSKKLVVVQHSRYLKNLLIHHCKEATKLTRHRFSQELLKTQAPIMRLFQLCTLVLMNLMHLLQINACNPARLSKHFLLCKVHVCLRWPP